MKKQLLFINGHLHTGGCERSLADLLRHIDYERFDVDLLLLEDLGEFEGDLPAEVNVIYYDTKKAFGSFPKTMAKALLTGDLFSIRYRLCHLRCQRHGVENISCARSLFKKVKPHYDAIIGYRPGISTDLAAFVFSADKKISWWHHGVYFDFGDLLPAYRKMDVINAVSESSAAIVREHFPEIRDKVRVIPNIISGEDLAGKAGSQNVERLKDLTLISVGRFSPEKNMTLCPKTAKILKEAGTRFRWYMVGDGAEYEEALALVREYGLEDNFVFTGALENPYPFVKAADLLIHPSLVESQGLSVLEAMALGTPVIVVRSAGPLEYIKDGQNGFLTDPDPASVAGKILALKDDAVRRTSVADAAKQTVKQYAPETILRKFYDQIDQK